VPDFLSGYAAEELVGFAAAVLTTAAFLPQTIKVVRTRDTRSISLAMYLLFTIGVALWLVYGLLIGSLPVVVANVLTLMQSGVILFIKHAEPPH
jgi:MtN3 and saliva related transmembrane protein